MILEEPLISVLGHDPDRTHRINANSFQQNAITTINGWQYAAFYTESRQDAKGICHVNLARRQVEPMEVMGTWQTFTFEDYEQTADDGHNTISIGVCRGDGTIHVAFDHHCDELRFRVSKFSVGGNATKHQWAASLFTKTQNCLPVIALNDLMKEVTYPRFVNIGNDLLLAYRIGQAGLGSDTLYRYSSATHQYNYRGQYHTGVSNSPYINGLDYRVSRLHASWCYRNFVPFDPSSNPHKQQAGPNGPENNHDLNYAYSDDLGDTWKGSDGEIMAMIGGKEQSGVANTIKPGILGARVFDIPMGSGILNQEAQTADWERGFWVLNREKVDGVEKWIVYHRYLEGQWGKHTIYFTPEPTESSSRGSICVDRKNNVYLILPGNTDSNLDIMRGCRADGYQKFESIWRSNGFDGEPLVDVQRLEESDVLSVFTRTKKSRKDKAAWLYWTSPCIHERRRENFKDARISELFSRYPEKSDTRKSFSVSLPFVMVRVNVPSANGS